MYWFQPDEVTTHSTQIGSDFAEQGVAEQGVAEIDVAEEKMMPPWFNARAYYSNQGWQSTYEGPPVGSIAYEYQQMMGSRY
jgi:hypothetical protein